MLPFSRRSISFRLLLLFSSLIFLVACNLEAAPANQTPLDLTSEPTQTGAAPTRTLLPTGNPPTSIPVTSITIPNQNTQSTQVVQLPPTSAFVPPTSSPTPISILILSPITGNIASGNVQVLGSAIHPQFLQYRLEYGPDPNPNNLWFPITGIVQNPILTGTLGIWNTTTAASPDGTYQLRLRVFLRDGTQQTTVVNGIRVQNSAPTPVPTNTPTTPRPIAAFTQDFTTGIAPLVVRFTSQSQGNITSYAWDFGGDGSSNIPNPIHTFSDPGVYTVTLTVIGPGGRSNVSRQINVSSATAPVAAFTANPTSGEAPFAVAFSNQSTGNITNYSWNFGDGGESNEVNPSHTFTDVGTYNVILEATGPGGTSTVVRQITVENPTIPEPVAGFAPDITSGDAPLTVTFNNSSTGEIDQYLWDFDGDGITDSVEESPSHIYEDAATYTARLTAIGPGGQSSVTSEIIVQQPPDAPIAAFSPSTTSGDAPLTVTFTNSSTGDATEFLWDFNNDGQPDSTDQNPSITFNDPGTFIVKLTANGAGGSTSAESTITVTAPLAVPVAGFEPSVTLGEAPLSVSFTNTSQGEQITYSWDFDGDGVPDSTDSNPTFEYTQPGLYTATLTVTNDAGTNTAAAEINVSEAVVLVPPTAAFSANPLTGEAPLTVAFTDESVGDIVSYEWDINQDGIADSSEQNPTFTFEQAGSYTVTLKVIGTGGEDSISTQITATDTIAVPIAAFTPDISAGVAPLTVNFSNTSQGDDLTYAWDFGDSVGTSTEQNPAYQFNNPGTYTVTLTATNSAGSNSISADIVVSAAVSAPIAAFTPDATTGTAPLVVNFTDASQGDDLTYAWDFGDGVGTSTEQNPAYQYDVPGTYPVTLTVTNSAGSNSISAQIVVTSAIAPPVADFNPDVSSGTAPLTVTFTDASQGEQLTYVWDFGDGVGTSTEQNPVYQYNTLGNYVVSQTVTNPGGSNSISVQIVVNEAAQAPVASFSPDIAQGDAPLTVTFINTSQGTIDTYSWDFNGDGVPDSTNPDEMFTFNDAGTYTVSLTVSGPGGQNVSQQTITVNQPAPQLPTGNIAFVSNRDGNNEIYVMNDDGSNAVNATNNGANDQHAVWSSDGSRIAFVSDRDGNDEIYVMNISDLSVARITDNSASDHSPAWSHDDSKIAFVSNREGDNDIFIMNSDGSDVTQITVDTTDDNSPTWSNDSTKIAYVSNPNGNNDIFVVEVGNTANIVQITTGDSNDQQPAWSPDGSRIAYTSDPIQAGDNDIYIMGTDGSNPIQITQNTANDQQPAWSPDSNRLIFVSNRNNGANNLFIIDAAQGATETQITNESSNNESPSWRP